MAGYEMIACVSISLHYLLRQFSRVPCKSIPKNEIGVQKPNIFILEHTIIQFENLPAQQLVIPIHNQKNLLTHTKLLSRMSQIMQSPLPLLIPLHLNATPRQFILLPQILLNKRPSSIGRSIVDNHNMVVGVVLHGYRPDVSEISVLVVVVVGGDYHTKWEFVFEVEVVFVLVVFGLHLCQSLQLYCLECVLVV